MDGMVTVASVLPIAVFEDERTARFIKGGGGGRADGHALLPIPELYIIEAGRDRTCWVAYATSAGTPVVALTGVLYADCTGDAVSAGEMTRLEPALDRGSCRRGGE